MNIPTRSIAITDDVDLAATKAEIIRIDLVMWEDEQILWEIESGLCPWVFATVSDA